MLILDFKTKTVARGKEGHYTVIKRSVQEDVTIVNIYAPNRSTSIYKANVNKCKGRN